jgi:hypothetical protein
MSTRTRHIPLSRHPRNPPREPRRTAPRPRPDMRGGEIALAASITAVCCLVVYLVAWAGMHALDEPDIFWPFRYLGL